MRGFQWNNDIVFWGLYLLFLSFSFLCFCFLDYKTIDKQAQRGNVEGLLGGLTSNSNPYDCMLMVAPKPYLHPALLIVAVISQLEKLLSWLLQPLGFPLPYFQSAKFAKTAIEHSPHPPPL